MPSLFLPCAGGVEALLADEVLRITGSAAETTRGGVWVEGDARTAMQLNLESRLAQRVLWPLIDGPYRDEHDLYDLARRVPWLDWLTPEHTLRVDVAATRPAFVRGDTLTGTVDAASMRRSSAWRAPSWT